MRAGLSLLLFLAALAAPVRAAEYVVDPAGDDGGPGSADGPWRTLRRAAGAARAGDVVLVRPGIYAESVPLSIGGAPGAPLTLRALPGVVLESPDPSASLSAFDLASGVGHVVIEGFQARGGYDETIMLRAGVHDVLIRHCALYDNAVGVWMSDAADIEVDDCVIQHNRLGVRIAGASRRVLVRDTISAGNDDGRGCDGDADGFSVEETSAEVTFEGCRAEDNGEDGFDLQGEAQRLVRVVSRGNACAGVKLSQNARVENTLVVGNETGIATTTFFGDPIEVQIVSSTIADNRGTQILLRSPAGGARAAASGYAALLRNVIAAGPGKVLEVDAGVVLSEDHNLFFRPDTTSAAIVRRTPDGSERRYSGQQINAGLWLVESGQGMATLAVDPGFLDRAEHRVAADSPAVDRGVASDAPDDDRAGLSRPLGGGVDIGPDEQVGRADHCPWADPGPDRTVAVGARVRVQAFGSVDPDGDPLTYAWDFGDGSPPSSGLQATHAYAVAGDYRLTLTASAGELSGARTAMVHVRPMLTATAAPTPTPTPSGATLHDSALRAAPRRVSLRAAAGAATGERRIVIAVRNRDVLPTMEDPGHWVGVVVELGSCAQQVVVDGPDFDSRLAGAQEATLIPGGRQRRAVVRLRREPGRAAEPPRRCVLRFIAVGPGADPTPQNNVAELRVDL